MRPTAWSSAAWYLISIPTKKKCFCQHQIVTLNILFIPVSIQSLAEGLPSHTSSFLPRKEGHREWKPTQSPSHRNYCVGKVQGSQDFSTTSNLSGNTLCSFPLHPCTAAPCTLLPCSAPGRSMCATLLSDDWKGPRLWQFLFHPQVDVTGTWQKMFNSTVPLCGTPWK